METKLSEAQATRLVQSQLNTMKSEELGAVLSTSDEMRRNNPDPIARQVGELMYQQVLAAFTLRTTQADVKL